MLENVAPEVWTAGATVKLPGARLPARMTVLRLPDGALLLHSPIAMDDALAAQVSALGPVAHVVAPNLLHHLFVSDALARFPGAALHAAPGLGKKRPDLPPASELGDEAPPAWQGAVGTVALRGQPSINETALFHKPSRTLIVADMLFNVREPEGFGTGLVLRTMGTYRRFAQSRLWGWSTKDRAAAAQSARRVLDWDFARVLVAHGEPVAENAHAATEAALARTLRG